MAGLKALIPLDGTQLSESAFEFLPLLKALGFDSLVLISIWESAWEEAETGSNRDQFGEATEKGRAYLQAYLGDQEAKAREAGFDVQATVRVGRAAEEIVEAASRVDLVLIATHGRSGIARWWLGSVADVVAREANCPVLVIGPNVTAELTNIKRILLPLDGSPEAENALPVAAWLADTTNSELDVVRCLSLTPVAYDPSMSIYSAELITSMEDAAREYLAGIKEVLGSRNVTTEMKVGSASELLIEHLQERPAGLVVMTSHGRSGVKRVALGSVTDRLLHGPSPVLVVRTGDRGRLLDQAKAASI